MSNQKQFHATQGADMVPVVFTITPDVAITSAFVRLSRDGVGLRDSTGTPEIVIDDGENTVTWTMDDDAIAAVGVTGFVEGELWIIDSADRKYVPREHGRFRLYIEPAATEPS